MSKAIELYKNLFDMIEAVEDHQWDNLLKFKKEFKENLEALAELAKPECKTCGGLKIVCKDDIGLALGGVAATCPRCKGTGIEPDCKPEPTETRGHTFGAIPSFDYRCKVCSAHVNLYCSSFIDSQQAENKRLNTIIDNRAEDLEVKAKYNKLKAENKWLKSIEARAVDIQNKANAANHKTYDLMRTVLGKQALSEDK